MNVTCHDWCNRCKLFHTEGMEIWREHKRYYDTRQQPLILVVMK